MGLRDADALCKKILELQDKKVLLNKKYEEVTVTIVQRSEKEKLLERIAKIRGEFYNKENNDNIYVELKKECDDLELEIEKLNNDFFSDLKSLKLDIPLDEPIIKNGMSEIHFENGPYEYLPKFLAQTMGTIDFFKIDDVECYKEKLIVKNVTSPEEVLLKLEKFLIDIGRLASIQLNEVDPDIMEVSEIIYNSKNNEVWEAINGKLTFSLEELYNILSANNSEDKKRIRNFITNLEIKLKDKYPFIKRGNGIYEFNFFGILVWNNYVKKYKPKISLPKAEKNNNIKEVEIDVNKKQNIMNNYLNRDEKKILYGRVIKNGIE